MIKNKKQALQDFMGYLYEEEHKEDGTMNKYYSPITKCHYLSKTEAKNHYVEYHRENLIITQNDVFKLDDIANLMDDEIRETVHNNISTDISAQTFFDRYCKLHFKKYKSEFVIN